MKAIQAKYKDDKQRQQQEMMKFYKENKVNPFGLLPPAGRAAAGLHLAVLHAARGPATEHLSRRSKPPGTRPRHTRARRPCGPHNGANFLFIPDITNKATGLTLIVADRAVRGHPAGFHAC